MIVLYRMTLRDVPDCRSVGDHLMTFSNHRNTPAMNDNVCRTSEVRGMDVPGSKLCKVILAKMSIFIRMKYLLSSY